MVQWIERLFNIFRVESSNPHPYFKKKKIFTSVFVTHGEMKKTVSLMLGFAMKHPVKKTDNSEALF